MKIIKDLSKNKDTKLPPRFIYKVEDDEVYIYFTNYKISGNELWLKQGDRRVAVLLMQKGEVEEFKKLFTKIRRN